MRTRAGTAVRELAAPRGLGALPAVQQREYFFPRAAAFRNGLGERARGPSAEQVEMANMVEEQANEPQREERPSPDCPEREARSKPENCEEKNDDCGSDQDTAHIRLSDEDQEPHYCDIDKA